MGFQRQLYYHSDRPPWSSHHTYPCVGTKGRGGCRAVCGGESVVFLTHAHTFSQEANKIEQDNLCSYNKLYDYPKLVPGIIWLKGRSTGRHPETTLHSCSWKPLSQLCSERTWPHFKRIIIKTFWDLIQTNDSTCSVSYMQCWLTLLSNVCPVFYSVLSWTHF